MLLLLPILRDVSEPEMLPDMFPGFMLTPAPVSVSEDEDMELWDPEPETLLQSCNEDSSKNLGEGR